MKQYRSHKIVQAAKIVTFAGAPESMSLVLDSGEEVSVTQEWMNRHRPAAGGYYVVYGDGYASWSPAEAFEEGYNELTAPKNRITPDDLEAAVVAQQSYVFPGTTVTVVCLTLRNGFTVVGHSACADPANFDAELGVRIARSRAIEQMWPLLGFELCTALKQAQVTP